MLKKRLLFKCVDCSVEKLYIPWRARKLKLNNGEYRCVDCSRSHNASLQTFEERSERMKRAHVRDPEMSRRVGRIRRSHRHTAPSVWHKKQMDTIKSDPTRYKDYCEKRRQISLNFHQNMTCEQKEAHYKKVFSNTKGRSKAEDCFFDVLKDVNICFKRGACISGFFPDGVDDENNIVVEFYGDTFHCNPKKFHNPEQYCSWISRTVQQQWDRDKKRLAVFYKRGYTVIIIWEDDWCQNQTACIERIKNALSKN